ncbi:nuclease-related domain-containing protein [Streptomyces sp. NPDC003023]|uniref:nuclease-related domain-containing protein n=1 Tax=Streptomyces sp. NPDC003023 TaxID=3364675 RepID=UPI00367E6D51
MLGELTVTSWQYFGHDRLYVNLPDGTAIGWADRRTGGITVVHPRYRDDVTDALARCAPELLTAATRLEVYELAGSLADPAGQRGTDRAGGRWSERTHPEDRTDERWAEQADGQRTDQGDRQGAEDADGPWTDPAPAGEPPASTAGEPDRTAGLGPLTAENDLASHRPGATLRAASPAGSAEARDSGRLERLSSRILRRRPMDDARRRELLGERRTGAELGRLTRHGWRVLHSVPLPDGGDVDHLLIGPGGVFSIRTEYHPQASVKAGDDTVTVDDGEPLPYIAECRAEADRVHRALSRHCDFRFRVQPVLVLVDARDLDVAATQTDVRVYRERQVSALAPLSGELTADQADRLHEIARHRDVWHDA